MRSNGNLQCHVYFGAIWLLISPCVLHAGEIGISPSLSLVEHYTDNLFLQTDSLKQKDYVTEVNPGLFLFAKGRRLQGNLSYVLQNIRYRNNKEYNTHYNKLRSSLNSELIENHLFFDVNGNIDQQPVSAEQGVSRDNINIGNRTNVKTLSLTPRYSTIIGNSVSSNFQYSRGIVRVQEGASNSVSDEFRTELASGREFSRFNWNLSYRNLNEKRDSGSKLKLENAFAQARYQFYTDLSLLGNIGYEHNDFESISVLNNGAYHSLGIGWTPNEYLGVDASYGNRYKSISINWNPTTRTSLNLNWRKTDVGVNTGKVWSGNFSLKNTHAQWLFNYREDTTSSQQLQLGAGGPSGGGESLVGGPSTGTGTPLGFGLTDEIFIRKYGKLSFEYIRAKSDFFASYYNETRTGQQSGFVQRYFGSFLSWKWRITPRTSFLISGGSEKRNFEGGLDLISDRYQYGSMGWQWQLRRRINTSLQYTGTKVKSNLETRDYRENRVTLSLNVVFSKNDVPQVSTQ